MKNLLPNQPLRPAQSALTNIDPGLTFNFYQALPGRSSSLHTQRAYFRWVDLYLVDVAGLKPTAGDERIYRMSNLPVRLLYESLSAAQFRAWLGLLARRGHGKQGIDQARAAIVVLTLMLAEAGWVDEYVSATMGNVRPPKAEEGQRPGRWLSMDEIRLMVRAAGRIATSENQEIRNTVVMMMLCTMALRREELASARWADLSKQNTRAVMRVHGKGKRTAVVDIPRPVLTMLDRWRRVTMPDGNQPAPNSPLVRRLWKGGRVSRFGLSTDGIWYIVDQASLYAGLGHVAPHDLRRSVAGALQESGVAIDKISRLLRHRNVAVTERYLSKLPQVNEGAVLMSDMLGLEDDSDADAWLDDDF
jgi:integrase